MARHRHRGGHGEGHGSDERWLLTYADMITLLMVFFVVLYAISNTDVRKFTALIQSISAAFNVDVLAGINTFTVTSGAEMAPASEQIPTGSGALTTDYQTIRATLRDYAIREGLEDRVEVTTDDEGIVIRIAGSLLFASGRARLDDDSTKLLDRLNELLRPLPNRVRVEGHTDDVPPSGPFYRDNWELSSARAQAVVRALAGGGIDPSRLVAAGYAEYRPLVANSDDTSRARNRRVDLVILYPDATSPPPGQAPT